MRGFRFRGRPAPAFGPRPTGVGLRGDQTCGRDRPRGGVSVRRGGALGGCGPAPHPCTTGGAPFLPRTHARGVRAPPRVPGGEAPRPTPRQQHRHATATRVTRCPAGPGRRRAHGPSLPTAAPRSLPRPRGKHGACRGRTETSWSGRGRRSAGVVTGPEPPAP